jgi:hypothetical protein
MDQGIIRSMKVKNRTMLVCKIIENYDVGVKFEILFLMPLK